MRRRRSSRAAPQGGNLEHQPSGLMWNIDNWIYITADTTRFHYKDGKLESGHLPRPPAGSGGWRSKTPAG